MRAHHLSALALGLVVLTAGCAEDDGVPPGPTPSASGLPPAPSSSATALGSETIAVSKGEARGDAQCLDSCGAVVVVLGGFAPEASVRISCSGDGSTIASYAVTTDAEGASTSDDCTYGRPGTEVLVTAGGVTAESFTWPTEEPTSPTSTPAAAPTSEAP